MHGRAHRDNDVADVLGDAGLLRDLHVGGDGRDGRAGAEAHGRGAEQLREHQLCRTLAAAEAGIDREGDEHVHKAQDVVDRERPAVVTDEIGAVIGDQIREEAEEADGGVVGDDLERLHDAARDVLKQLRGLCFRAARHLHAEAEQDGCHDEREDGLAAPEVGEIGLGEEVDDHVADAERAADLALDQLIFSDDRRNDQDDDVGDDGGDGGGGQERADRDAHDLARAPGAAHVGDGRGDRAEHRRDGNAEHQVQEHRAERLEHRRALDGDLTVCSLDRGPERTDDAAGDDAGQHQDQKTIIFPETTLFHSFSS